MFWNKKKTEKPARQNLGRRIAELFGKTDNLDDFYDELEEILIAGDMGGTVAMEIVDELRERVKRDKIKDKQTILDELRAIVADNVKTVLIEPEHGKMNVFLVLGVNGVGKNNNYCQTVTILQEERF